MPLLYLQQFLAPPIHEPPQYFITSYDPVTTPSKLLDFQNGHRPDATVALIKKIGVHILFLFVFEMNLPLPIGFP